jgi:FAD/FMN-containing dehydrogenase
MKSISIDPVRRIARVSAGVTALELVSAAAARGLAPALGECATVGAGLALGGGVGWLSGLHGATCDNVLSAQIVTASTDLLTVSPQSHEDLYWAIRGGGGNFGVVTEFAHRLHPIGQVLAGGLSYPARDARTVLPFFRDFMSTAPDALQALAYLTSAEDGTLMIVLVHAGELDAGRRLVDRFRQFRAPQRDWVKPRAYPDVYTMSPYSDPGPPCADHGGGHGIRGVYIEHLSDDAIDVILARFSAAPPACEFGFDLDHYMHGQVCRVAPDATAFGLRAAGAIHLAFGAQWSGPERAAACTAWLDETWRRLQPYSGGRVYANYSSIDGAQAAIAAYGGNLPRLALIKRRYDPDNAFRRNLNIAPG